MQESKFQFKEPKLIELEYTVLHDLKDAPKEINETVSISIECAQSMAIDKPRALVSLKINTNDENNPFRLHCVMQSEFSWTSDLGEEKVKKLLAVNAPALIFSYMRPIIHLVASNSVYRDIRIPFIDFTQEKE